jgi:hypothetical protein
MPRLSSLLVLAFLTAGCRLPPDGESLRALPENRLYSYDQLLQRARAQATAAVEAFYVDAWRDLEDAAAALEQTSHFLPRTTNIPASMRDKLVLEAGALHRDADKLGEAARARDVQRANELLQHINLKVRQLRPLEDARPERAPEVDASR